MTICTSELSLFPSLNHKKIAVDFSGGHVSSDGGVLLLRKADRRLGLTRRIAGLIKDDRDQSKVIHSMQSMLRQRVYGLACGHEDCNDHDDLRHDIALQTATETTSSLASSPTLCRFESSTNRALAVAAHGEMVESFITRNTRRISFRMSSHYPYKELFMLAAKRLSMT